MIEEFSRIRDLLLPGMHQAASEAKLLGANIELDATVSEDGLMVTAFDFAKNKSISFCLTPDDLTSGSYKEKFAPSLRVLMRDVGSI